MENSYKPMSETQNSNGQITRILDGEDHNSIRLWKIRSQMC